MATSIEEVISKTEMVEIDPKSGVLSKTQTPKEAKRVDNTDGKTENQRESCENGMKLAEEPMKNERVENKKEPNGEEEKIDMLVKDEDNKEEVAVEVEPKTGVSFPVKMEDGKQLYCVGLRKKSILGMGIKIYGFGIYADTEKLKDVLRSKIGKAPLKPTKELYQAVIDGDFGMTVRLIIVYSGLTMSMVTKSFDEGLGAAIKKLTGGRKNEELTNKVMGEASDDIKLIAGSVIEISKLPGYVLQTKVRGEVVSKVGSELLCRAYIYMYLGDDAFDKDAKEKFGMSMLSLF